MPTRALLSWTTLTLAAAFAAVAAPLWTYAVSLALFGLPHVLVELRYVDRAFAPGLGRRMVRAVLVGLGAIAFAGYHPLHDAQGALVAQRAVFYLGAGVYFGVVYLKRGFGVVVATHALYDIATAFLVGAPTESAP